MRVASPTVVVVLLSFIITLVSSTGARVGRDSVAPAHLGTFSLVKPAFAQFLESPDSGERVLVLCAFRVKNPTKPADTTVSTVKLDSWDLDDVDNTKPVLLTDSLIWPNHVTAAPQDGKGAGSWIVAGGFLVPGNTHGALSLVSPDGSSVEAITPDTKQFYHMATAVDVNGDGVNDLLTGRAKKPITGGGSGEAVYLPGPDYDTVVPLYPGPDTFFELVDLDGDGATELIAGEFWAKQLTVRRNWEDPLSVEEIVVDNSIGPVFEATVFKSPFDGRLKILATNHMNKPKQTGLFLYDVPSEDLSGGEWPRTVLATDFPMKKKGPGQAAPGSPVVFAPFADDPEDLYIVLAGDASMTAYVYHFTAVDAVELVLEIPTGGVTGGIAVGDVDGDGAAEVVIPSYDSDEVLVYSFGASL